MKVEHINHFLRAVVNAFSTMINCEARRGEISLGGTEESHYPISGIIGLFGKALGTVVISLSEEVALKVASTMLMTEMTEIDADMIDAVGELANMVAGQAKAELEDYELRVSLPNVVTGENHEIRFASDIDTICVPFDTDFGPLQLEVGLEPVCEPASV